MCLFSIELQSMNRFYGLLASMTIIFCMVTASRRKPENNIVAADGCILLFCLWKLKGENKGAEHACIKDSLDEHFLCGQSKGRNPLSTRSLTFPNQCNMVYMVYIICLNVSLYRQGTIGDAQKTRFVV